ncbi:FMN-dependent NADH-azoreductase [Pseudoalteromonas fenneropenaei]|uniref:FMN dependent NADH:quinone oxidoreductase n=1 Tax=Pseudoalteromonas fenneropenaei TaxID=1737459 RepID=A0ABV7CG18_9GAMM
MKNILHIDASARKADREIAAHNSISRQLGQKFITRWMSLSHQTKVCYRDLYQEPIPFIDADWIAAVFAKPAPSETQQQHLDLSDRLIAEVAAADLIVITTPMYNYGMPAILKAWFDQVIRVNKTFSFDLARGDYPLEPILTGKTLVLLTSSGEFGFAEGLERAQLDHLVPHIKLLSRYLGVADFYVVRSEYQEFADARHQHSRAQAEQQAVQLAEQLASIANLT